MEVNIDPNGPFGIRRDSCERDRFDRRFLKQNRFFSIKIKIDFYKNADCLFAVVKGGWFCFCRSSFVTLFVRFNESIFVFDDGSSWFDLLLIDDRPKKWENFVFDCRVFVVVVMDEGRSDDESRHNGIS